MRQINYSLVAALAIVATLNASEYLGLITVESTTIDDKYESTKNEVSNVVVVNAEEIEKINQDRITEEVKIWRNAALHLGVEIEKYYREVAEKQAEETISGRRFY